MFRRLFREVGLPDAIRTDNGAPFASTGIHGLCALNVWWMQLGIVHQRIHAGESARERHPRADASRAQARDGAAGRAAACAPSSGVRSPSGSATTTSARTKASAIAGPASLWLPSLAPLPGAHRAARLSGAPGGPAREHGGHVPPARAQPFLSHALRGEDIGLEEVGDGIWNIVYYRTLLGRIDERTGTITGV